MPGQQTLSQMIKPPQKWRILGASLCPWLVGYTSPTLATYGRTTRRGGCGLAWVNTEEQCHSLIRRQNRKRQRQLGWFKTSIGWKRRCRRVTRPIHVVPGIAPNTTTRSTGKKKHTARGGGNLGAHGGNGSAAGRKQSGDWD